MSDAPLPPAPLLSPLEAGAAAAAAAVGQLWGWLNSRMKQKQELQNGTRYEWPTPRTVSVSGSWNDTGYSQKICSTNATSGTVPSGSGGIGATYNNVVGLTLEGIGSYSYGFDCGSTNLVATVQAAGNFHLSNGSTARVVFRSLKSGTGKLLGSPRPYSIGSPSNGVIVTGVTAGGVPFVLPDITDPNFTPPEFDPEAEPLADPAQRPPLPLAPPVAPPDTAPPDAEPLPVPGDPGTGTGTGTGSGTATGGAGQLLPLRPPLVFPVPPPTGTEPEIGDGLAKPPVVVVPAPVTPPGTEVIPGGVIGQPGTAPAPNLEAMAQELGKIEQKTRALLNRPVPDFDFGSLTDLLQLLLNLLQQVYGPGQYELEPVCEDKPTAVVNWQGGVGAFAQVNVKLDALAELLQAHKDFRQPICLQKASGEEVTVIFEEI